MKRRILFSVVIYNLLFALPAVVLLFYAFSSMWRYPDIIPRRFDMHGLSFISGEFQGIARGLGGSFLYSLCTVALTFIMTVLPASEFARRSFPFKHLAEGLFLSPALIPSMAFAAGIQFIFIKIGISDSTTGVVLILSLVSYPYMLRALTAGFQAIGTGYRECALNLGSGRLTALLRVEIPLLVPAIISGASVVFLVAFSEYFLVFLMGGGSVPSYSGYLFPFLNSSDRSAASTLTLIFLIIPILLFALTDGLVLRSYRKKGLS
jgi:putative spermidine/putrescine transport system permease protein